LSSGASGPKCHTDTCPTGVATQNPWLAPGWTRVEVGALRELHPHLRRDLLKLAEARASGTPG
jgi:glutamate synthase domain-containing protein 2